MTLPYLNPMNPYAARPVNARWQRVVHLAYNGKRANGPWDDDWVRYGLHYFKRLQACRNESERTLISQGMSDLDAAYRLYTASDKMERAVVEARLLAGQTVEETAAACNLPEKVIVAYEEMFFHVLESLKGWIYILFNAVGMPLDDEKLTEDDRDILLKFYAYRKGPLFLEDLLRYFRNGIRVPERLDQASRDELEELVVMLELEAVVLSRVLPLEKCIRVFRAMTLAREVQAYIASMPDQCAAEPASNEFSVEVKMLPPPEQAASLQPTTAYPVASSASRPSAQEIALSA